jgi:homoserine dehydrogenase
MVAERVDAAAEEGGHLRYLASLRDGKARVGLETVPRSHPCASLYGTDNLFAFTTARYRERPLVVRGPGAGTAVTAAGVIADLLQAHAEAAPDRLIDMDPSFGSGAS